MKLLTRLFALVILTLIPVIGVEIYDEIEARRLRAEEGRDQAVRLVRLVAQQQAKVIEGAHQLLTALGKTPMVRRRDVAACSPFFGDLVGAYPQYLSLVSIDLDGHAICSSETGDPAPFFRDRPFFRLAVQNRDFTLGEYDSDTLSPRRAIYLAQPYDDPNGKMSGVVAAALGLDWLNGEIARNPLPPNATVSVVDRRGTILARFPHSERFVGTQIQGQSHAYMLSGSEGVREALGFDGVTRIYSYTPLPGPPGLTLSVGLDKGDLLKGPEAANRRDIVVLASSCALALLLAAVGGRVFLSRPIRILLAAAEHWRQGDLEARVPFTEARSEFGRLGAAFNGMAAAIGAREQELERRVRERTEALTQAMAAQQAAEAALHESRKIEAIGRLTGGVAHDFNNILASIVGNLELAHARLGASNPAASWLDAAMQSAKRGAALVQQLLAFARRQNLRPEVVDLNRSIRNSRDMLQRLLRSDVTVEIELASQPWLVEVDPNQLEAAILNLAINARDAMPNGGVLRLETRNVTLTRETNESGLDGDFVALIVSDTGTGIAPEIMEKVFDPFFTTKAVGAGSGLGLSMVQGFVQQSAGSVVIDSSVGQGTSVTLYLPRTTEPLKPSVAKAEQPIAGQGTILLVDDNASVRSVTAELLEMSGYSVRAAGNAEEASQCFEQEGGQIDVLITDLVLADGVDGIALAQAMRDRQPGLPVLLITGYSDALLQRVAPEGMPVLTKPFDHVTLTKAIRDAMQVPRSGLSPPEPNEQKPAEATDGAE